jgi:hypothetical protein
LKSSSLQPELSLQRRQRSIEERKRRIFKKEPPNKLLKWAILKSYKMKKEARLAAEAAKKSNQLIARALAEEDPRYHKPHHVRSLLKVLQTEVCE